MLHSEPTNVVKYKVLLVDLQSHAVSDEIQLGCPLDDLGQLREYAN